MCDFWTWMGDHAIDIVGLCATLLLLLVTFLSTRAARDMATLARDAAAESARATEAAERSAQAALDAARVAQARINVEFKGRMISLAIGGSVDDRDGIPTVEVRAAGDAVVVQRVRVKRAFRIDANGQLHKRASIVDDSLTPAGETLLPKRLHHGERIHLTHPAMYEDGDGFGRFILLVEYTFTEGGGTGGTRELVVTDSMS